MKKHHGGPVRLCGLYLTIAIFLGIIFTHHQPQAADSKMPIYGAEVLAPMEPATALRNGVGFQGVRRWTFEAHGQRFELDLDSNERLVAALAEERRQEILTQHTFLRGRMRGRDASWVRLTVSAQGTSGMIWDGQQLFVVQPAIQVETQLIPDLSLSDNDDRLIIYRYDDQSHAPLICGTEHHLHGNIQQPYAGLIAELQANLESLEANAPNGVLHVVLVEDQHWNQDSYAIFNTVDGIYNSHFGISISIDSDEVAQIHPTSGSELLSAFRQYIGNRSRVGIAHLMSGRSDTGWAGIAYLRSLCSSYAIGVSTYHGFSDTVTIVAHEVGHNAGAEHDQNHGCGTGQIMDAYVSGSQTFSSCSIDMMSPFIANATCIEPEMDPDPDLNQDGDVDGMDLYNLSGMIQRNEISDINGTVEAMATSYGQS